MQLPGDGPGHPVSTVHSVGSGTSRSAYAWGDGKQATGGATARSVPRSGGTVPQSAHRTFQPRGRRGRTTQWAASPTSGTPASWLTTTLGGPPQGHPWATAPPQCRPARERPAPGCPAPVALTHDPPPAAATSAAAAAIQTAGAPPPTVPVPPPPLVCIDADVGQLASPRVCSGAHVDEVVATTHERRPLDATSTTTSSTVVVGTSNGKRGGGSSRKVPRVATTSASSSACTAPVAAAAAAAAATAVAADPPGGPTVAPTVTSQRRMVAVARSVGDGSSPTSFQFVAT